ncbi:hypothetical protein G7Y89_g11703 [Cudoniella acicularis]|uniref:Peptidase S8/S53 domain-containing protein n=1 Tax=Cudoniella acicularis TaxID=354080 RepID=A0A8H4VXS3_9HELO|nr:hypothetical protein G7Y89_g11703 [Cudoniella acicularis]
MNESTFINRNIGKWITNKQFELFKSKFKELLAKSGTRSGRPGGPISIGTCRSFLEEIIKGFPSDSSEASEKQRWLDVLLTCGDDVWLRDILDEEVIDIGQHADYPDDLKHVLANEIFNSVVEKFTALLESRNKDNKRSLFHVAAVHGSYEVITTCHRMLVEKYGETDGHIRVLQTIMENDKDGKGQSALFHAVEFSQTKVVERIMAFYHSADESIIVPVLVRAIQLRRLETTKALLAANPGDKSSGSDELQTMSKSRSQPKTTFHQHFITLECFQAAIEDYDKGILTFLLDQNIDILKQPNCTLLHSAIKIGRYDAVELLAEKCPELATTTENELDLSSGRNIPRPVLHHVNLTNDDGHKIRELILPVLMKRLEISALRDHLPGSSWGEIYLDLTFLTTNTVYLKSFLESVHEGLCTTRETYSIEAHNLTRDFRQERKRHRKSLWTDESKQVPGDNESTCPDITLDVRFERVLKYIEIPFFDTKMTSTQTDILCIFDWLCICKGVRNILEVRVQDSRYTPYSEEDIEDSLSQLEIQELDWRRTDLSIYTILACAPDVERLHLYSSGNLATIDHWTGPNGVIKLTNDDLSSERVKLCLDILAEKLNSLFPEERKPIIRSEIWEIKKDMQGQVKPKDIISKHDPKSVTQLGHFLKKYEVFQDESPDLQLLVSKSAFSRRAKTCRTKVAILDTGVIAALFSGSGHRVTGRSFVHRNPGKYQRESPWWLATDPHGSHIANIISSLDPRCDFYIAQVGEKKNQISQEAVSKAFKWVIEEGVQIINCSFALFEPLQDIEDQINAAKDEGIVVISSTSDEGYIRQDVWPAKYGYSNVISIAACDFNGKLTAYSSEISAAFRLQGEQIDVSSPDSNLQHSKDAVISGSSVATAMATGIGSLILACQQMHRNFVRDAIDQSGDQVIHTAFRKMISPDTKNQLAPIFLQPRFVLPTEEDRFSDNDDFKRWVKGAFGRILKS